MGHRAKIMWQEVKNICKTYAFIDALIVVEVPRFTVALSLFFDTLDAALFIGRQKVHKLDHESLCISQV